MRRLRVVVAGWVVAHLPAGCLAPAGPLDWQLDYARNCPDPVAATNMTIGVARSAAYMGYTDSVFTALRDLRDDPRHDEVAGQCATQLAAVGKPADARRVAKRIADPDLRRQALDKLAEMAAKANEADPTGGQADAPPADPTPQ